MNIEMIWKNIRLYEGEIFRTVSGVEYRYTVYNEGYIFINDDRRRMITKKQFNSAILINNPTPSKIKSAGIWGPSYVCGIITDKRIISP